MNLLLTKEKLYKVGRIIFWLYIIFMVTFNLVVNILSYKKVETFTTQRVFELQPSLEELSQQIITNNKTALSADEEKKSLILNEILFQLGQWISLKMKALMITCQ